MNGEQFFDLLGELDETMILAATVPPKRRRPLNVWLFTAAAAVVVGVLGYAGLMRAWQSPPPIAPPAMGTTVTTGTATTTEGAVTRYPTTVADTTANVVYTTTATENTTDTAELTTYIFGTTASSNTTTATRLTGPDTIAPTTGSSSGGTGTHVSDPKNSTTTTVSTTHVSDPVTVPITQGTMPDGLPRLNSDHEVETDRLNGYVDFVMGYSFEELEVQSITGAPSVLPVYAVTEKRYERDSLTDIIEEYRILTDDTLVSGVYDDGKSAGATGVRFRYHIDRGQGNYIMLSLMKPIALGTPEQWLSQVTAYCPALFRDMGQPMLHRWNGSRWWNQQYTDSPATAQETVSFYARIYDAAVTDGTARWLNGVSLKIEDGKLTALCVMFEENYEKLGDYPILSVAEATALAREQCETLKAYPHYSIISENYMIVSTELVYMPHSASGLRVPLYRFLVTTDGAEYMSSLRAETGMTMYYAVYVTAVPPEYWTAESADRFITQQ